MKFSLVLCTINRRQELLKFLTFLEKQSYQNFELFIMDQNRNNLIDDIVFSFQNKYKVKHIKLELAGLSKARNAGLKLAHGDIICFPDDDCWFEDKHLLKKIINKFQESKNLTGLSIPVTDENGRKIIIPWPTESCYIDKSNLFKTITSISFFIKNSAIKNKYYFDECMGVGSNKIAAGEETDFLLKIILDGHKLQYTPDIDIQHPRPYEDSNNLNYDKIYQYSFALGFMLKKHSFPLLYKYNLLLRPIIAFLIYFYNSKIRKKYFYTFLGRYYGMRSKI
jgi:glycosyltransferase involved in cell wall biosynthesis